MVKLVDWAQAIVTFRPEEAVSHLADVACVFKLHLALGLTIFVIFPFTRLVHFWSIPLEYIFRRYQIVQKRR